jgi:hypothetical protein
MCGNVSRLMPGVLVSLTELVINAAGLDTNPSNDVNTGVQPFKNRQRCVCVLFRWFCEETTPESSVLTVDGLVQSWMLMPTNADLVTGPACLQNFLLS